LASIIRVDDSQLHRQNNFGRKVCYPLLLIFGFRILESGKLAMVHVRPEVDQLLYTAITKRRLIRFFYKSKERIAEPHDYGIQNGRALLLTYQISGQSNSGKLPAWRWIDVAKIRNLDLLERTFSGNRPARSGQHHQWDQLFVRVSNDQDEDEPVGK
jgi:hypothetical protein